MGGPVKGKVQAGGKGGQTSLDGSASASGKAGGKVEVAAGGDGAASFDTDVSAPSAEVDVSVDGSAGAEGDLSVEGDFDGGDFGDAEDSDLSFNTSEQADSFDFSI